MVYLVNAFAPNMLPLGRHVIEFNMIKPQNAAKKILRLAAKGSILNCIGHKKTEGVIKRDLVSYNREIEEIWVSGRRLTVRVNPALDSLLIASYRGKRLRENAPELPAGAQIIYWRACWRYDRTLNVLDEQDME